MIRFHLGTCVFVVLFVTTNLVQHVSAQQESEPPDKSWFAGLGINAYGAPQGDDWQMIRSGFAPHVHYGNFYRNHSLFAFFSAGMGFYKSDERDSLFNNDMVRYQVKYRDFFTQATAWYFPFRSNNFFRPIGVVGSVGLHNSRITHQFGEEKMVDYSFRPGWGIGLIVNPEPSLFMINLYYYRLHQQHTLAMTFFFPFLGGDR